MPFTDEPWNSPESDLSPEEFCSVCLIDANAPGAEKLKSKCWLPVRKSRGAPINKNAVHAAAGGHGVTKVKGAPADKKRAAARKLVSLYREMSETPPASLLAVAGMKRT